MKDNQISLELRVLERKTLLCRTVPKEDQIEKMIYKMGDGAELNILKRTFIEVNIGLSEETEKKLFVVTEGEKVPSEENNVENIMLLDDSEWKHLLCRR